MLLRVRDYIACSFTIGEEQLGKHYYLLRDTGLLRTLSTLLLLLLLQVALVAVAQTEDTTAGLQHY